MKKKTQGFTLIELLVVIAIIGVLIALIAPAIASTRERATIVSCMNNMKQISIAAFMYADDHNSIIPDVPDTINYVQDNTRIYKCPRDTDPDRAAEPSYTAWQYTPASLLPANVTGPLYEKALYVETDQAGTEKAKRSTEEGKFNTIVREDIVFRHDGPVVTWDKASNTQRTVVVFADGRALSCSKAQLAALEGIIILERK